MAESRAKPASVLTFQEFFAVLMFTRAIAPGAELPWDRFSTCYHDYFNSRGSSQTAWAPSLRPTCVFNCSVLTL